LLYIIVFVEKVTNQYETFVTTAFEVIKLSCGLLAIAMYTARTILIQQTVTFMKNNPGKF
jgi:hypothetical protein